MFTEAILKGFSEELLKIASDRVAKEDLKEIKDKLKPGDVFITKARWEAVKELGLHHMLFRGLDVLVQGTPYTHAAMYLGKDKVVDATTWNGEAKVHEVPLKDFAERYEFKALRVHAKPKEKKDAVAWAKKQIGKPYDMGLMLRLALPGSHTHEKRKRQENLDSMVCSQLVSNAYPNQPFGKGKEIQHVLPKDILHSTLTKQVAELK